MTTSSNTEIQELKNFLSDRFFQLDRRIDELKTELTLEIASSQAEIKKDISNLDLKIESIKGDIKGLSEKIDGLKYKNYNNQDYGIITSNSTKNGSYFRFSHQNTFEFWE